MSIGDNIKKYRIRRNLTQHELSIELKKRNIKIGDTAISSWENNRTTPDVDTVVELCKILNIDMDTILGLKDMMTSTNPTLNTIFEELEIMPDEKRKKVLEYIEFLKTKK